VALQTRARRIIEYNLNINLATGSERQKLAYLAALPEQLDQTISLHARFAGDDRAARELAATSVLMRKGRVQDALSDSVSSLRDRLSEQDKVLLDRLKVISSQLARLVLEGPENVPLADHQKKIKGLEEQREKLESEVSRRSSGFYRTSRSIDLADVQRAIPSDAVLIEFAIYRPFDPRRSAQAYGEPSYIVYVLNSRGEIGWKDLGPARGINETVTSLRRALRDPKSKDALQLARVLDEKVMRPVRELVGDAGHLLVSPDGDLNLIPFEALVDEKGRHLVENYSITYLTTGRDLVRMKEPRASRNGPAVIANPVFGEQDPGQLLASASRAKSAPASKRRSITNTRGLADTYFAPLSGTALEANSIKSLFPESKLVTGATATETAVKELAAPKVLHIATHGFFLDDGGPGDSQNSTSRGFLAAPTSANPLLRSGLAFAGANTRGGKQDDGILTALEATGLDLWGTKLVVLSACDTGIGEIRNGEGVFGLRRSFALAGAESLLMSLWPISDQVTRELMTKYYQNLKQGMGRGEALRQVQLEMIKRPARRHPFYWASFIQSGEWANLDGKR
jgi:CHAT domain-containing protein